MKIADDTFLGNSECEWVNSKVIVKNIIDADDNFWMNSINGLTPLLLQGLRGIMQYWQISVHLLIYDYEKDCMCLHLWSGCQHIPNDHPRVLAGI